MSWTLDDSKAIYLQLSDEVKRRIITGTYPAGEYLPSVRDLAAEAQVNPNTMQRALTQLESEGYLTTMRGSGRIVSMDTEAIDMEKKRLAESELYAVIDRIGRLGITGDELLAMVKNCIRRKEEGGNRDE